MEICFHHLWEIMDSGRNCWLGSWTKILLGQCSRTCHGLRRNKKPKQMKLLVMKIPSNYVYTIASGNKHANSKVASVDTNHRSPICQQNSYFKYLFIRIAYITFCHFKWWTANVMQRKSVVIIPSFLPALPPAFARWLSNKFIQEILSWIYHNYLDSILSDRF